VIVRPTGGGRMILYSELYTRRGLRIVFFHTLLYGSFGPMYTASTARWHRIHMFTYIYVYGYNRILYGCPGLASVLNTCNVVFLFPHKVSDIPWIHHRLKIRMLKSVITG
jgi:hypothetical protein